MATQYSIGDFQAFMLTASPVLEIVPVPSVSAKLVEVTFSMEVLITAQVTVLGIGAPQVAGLVPIDNRFLQAEFLGPAGLIQVATDWQVPPTSPVNFFRRINILGAAGNAGRGIFRFPQGLRILPTQTLVVWCITSVAKGNFCDVNVLLEC
jgi:hypothetical protein